MDVDGHFATVRTEVSEVGRIFGCRHRRGNPDGQAEEALYVDDLRPCNLAAVVSQTAQRALVSGIRVWIIAYVWFLAKSAQVVVRLLWKKNKENSDASREVILQYPNKECRMKKKKIIKFHRKKCTHLERHAMQL